jgi:hypothetical protein
MTTPTRRALALLALCAGLRIVSLGRPCLSDDEATYCVVAREMLHGRVLYRDVVDHKPPLIYLTYGAAQALGGVQSGMFLLHLLTIIVVWATALVLARIARQTGDTGSDDGAPFAAALLYVVFTTTLLDFDALAANCELYMLLPLTASVLFYLRGFTTSRPADLLAAGALVGVAILYKYQAAVPTADARRVSALAGWSSASGRRRRSSSRSGCSARRGRSRRRCSGSPSTALTFGRGSTCRRSPAAQRRASPTASCRRCCSGCWRSGPRSCAGGDGRRIRPGSGSSSSAGAA